MLNGLWLGFFIVAAVAALARWLLGATRRCSPPGARALFDMARLSVEVMILLFGTLTLWLGFLRIAEQAGLVDGLARLLGPLFAPTDAGGAARPSGARLHHPELRRQRPGPGQRGHADRPEGDARAAGAEPEHDHGEQCADPVPGAQRLVADPVAGVDLHVPRAAGRGRPDAGVPADPAGDQRFDAGRPAGGGADAAPAPVGPGGARLSAARCAAARRVHGAARHAERHGAGAVCLRCSAT